MKIGKWICFPGDYEIMLAEKVQTRRFQRDFPIGPFWRVDSPWHNIKFFKEFSVEHTTTLKFYYEGRISVFFYDYDFRYEFDGEITLPAGNYKMEIWLYNPNGLPCLKIDGDDICTGTDFLVGVNHIDLVNAFICNCGDLTPNTYHLNCERVDWISEKQLENGKLFDFGKIDLRFLNITGKGKYKVYFGETIKETMADKDCEQVDFFQILGDETYRTPVSKAFRYMRIVTDSVYSMFVETEIECKQSITDLKFENKFIEKMFNIAKYTFSVCSKEFYLDGAKRDRWLWGGDAYVAEKAEYFYNYDTEKIKRNIIALFGKSPVIRYINHVMDYTFYTIISVLEYYEHTKDIDFLNYIYPIMKEHMDFCLTRLSKNKFICSIPQKNGNHVDWIFVDWGVDLEKNGEVCSEQVLLYGALKSFSKICSIIGENCETYESFADSLKQRVNQVFWNEEKGIYMFARNNGVVTDEATCHANVFALLYDFVDDNKKARIIDNLKSCKYFSLSITPFMITFCLESLFINGEYKKASEIMEKFWGGMTKLDVSTFWETYFEGEQVEDAVAMYGRPFGRSQCHIWGAGPLYLIPRFYYGVRHCDFGNSFTIEPIIELIKNSTITLPLYKGTLTIECYNNQLKITSTDLVGKLIINKQEYTVNKGMNYYGL